MESDKEVEHMSSCKKRRIFPIWTHTLARQKQRMLLYYSAKEKWIVFI